MAIKIDIQLPDERLQSLAEVFQLGGQRQRLHLLIHYSDRSNRLTVQENPRGNTNATMHVDRDEVFLNSAPRLGELYETQLKTIRDSLETMLRRTLLVRQ